MEFKMWPAGRTELKISNSALDVRLSMLSFQQCSRSNRIFRVFVCRQMKPADVSTSLEQRPRVPDDDASESPYQSPSSLPSSTTSDAEAKTAIAWHTPRGSPRPSAAVSHISVPNGAGDSTVLHTEVVDVGIQPEVTSSEVSVLGTEQRPSDVEHGKNIYISHV